MTEYTTHSDAIFQADKPILASTGLEARDNLLAVTEGDPTAPKIKPLALNTQIGSASFNVPAEGSTQISINAYSFFPSVAHSGTATITFQVTTGSANADAPRIRVYNPSTSNQTVTVAWRYIAP